MSKGRMEAFSDGVIAIIITIMVLELKVPRTAELTALRPVLPVFLIYAVSYLYLGIYWSNHHHLLQATAHVNGRVLWANLHLLFWLSLFPFVTGWVGHTEFAPWPMAIYGMVLLCAAVAYYILTRSLLTLHGRESVLAAALGRDLKGRLSVLIYVVAIPLAFVGWWLAGGLYFGASLLWIVPDRRIEKTLSR